METRSVGLPVLFKLIFSKKPFGIMGVVFTGISLFFVLPMVIFMSDVVTEPYENYDYDKIMAKGADKDAVVLDVSEVTNITVNGEHPQRITFRYPDTRVYYNDTFQTFDLDKTAVLQPGDTIAIKAYGRQAVVVGMEPFHFPFWIFYMLPGIFFILGSIFLLVALVPALKLFSLYKTGQVREGVITSLMPTAGMPVSGMGRKIMVDYYFTGRQGNKIYGNGTTSDFSILGEKKAGDTIKLFVSNDEQSSCLVPEKEARKYGWRV